MGFVEFSKSRAVFLKVQGRILQSRGRGENPGVKTQCGFWKSIFLKEYSIQDWKSKYSIRNIDFQNPPWVFPKYPLGFEEYHSGLFKTSLWVLKVLQNPWEGGCEILNFCWKTHYLKLARKLQNIFQKFWGGTVEPSSGWIKFRHFYTESLSW